MREYSLVNEPGARAEARVRRAPIMASSWRVPSEATAKTGPTDLPDPLELDDEQRLGRERLPSPGSQ